jgi:hypothetical protein
LSEVWGRFELGQGQLGCWTVGPLSLWVLHRERDWRTASVSGPDHLVPDAGVRCPCDDGFPESGAKIERFAFRRTDGVLHVLPRTADRPVVARPETPFHLLPGEEVVLYMTSPLWVTVEVGEARVEILDVATYRLSDTWFGPNTRTGELCYASKTSARLRQEHVLYLPSRCSTAVVVRNDDVDDLHLERVRLPMPNLALHVDPDGQFWTDSVVLTLERGRGTGEASATTAEPEGERTLSPVRPARVSPPRSFLWRAFGKTRG